jgi:hypothetical protein
MHIITRIIHIYIYIYTYIHTYERTLTYADVCWRMLPYAPVCWRLLTYAHVCSRMLTYAHVRSRMLTDGGQTAVPEIKRSRLASTILQLKVSSVRGLKLLGLLQNDALSSRPWRVLRSLCFRSLCLRSLCLRSLCLRSLCHRSLCLKLSPREHHTTTQGNGHTEPASVARSERQYLNFCTRWWAQPKKSSENLS